MPEAELNFDQPRMRLGRLPVMEPSADLWQRIVAEQDRRRRRSRGRRLAALGGTAVVAGTFLIGLLSGAFDRRAAEQAIDWQARAQALELQLRAQSPASHDRGADFAADAQNELILVDSALQAAYDDGAGRDRVTALWKRRSELLSALLQARRQDLEISRI
jgi:choline dehydrogenase-like flavoprotein